MTADTPTPAARSKLIPLLVLAGLAVYANSFTKAFVFDDDGWITRNPDIRADAGRYVRSMGRPVVSATLWLNYRFGGLNTTGYHAVNLAVHVLAALTLFGVVRRVLLLPRWGGRYADPAPYLAFAVALLWLVHPLQTQAVTYVVQRCESMMGLFYLLTLYCWVRGATGGRLWYPAGVAAFALSCGCKEVAATLPPVLLLFDRVFLARSWRELVRERWLGYVGILVAWGWLLRPAFATASGGGTAAGVGVGVVTATPYTYLLTESEVILHYLRLAVWPVGQCLDYLDWPVAGSLCDVWPSFAAVALLVAAGFVLLFVRPAAGFVVLWFFLILGPTSSVVPIVDPAFEHRMYLPLAAVAVGFVFAAHAAARAAGRPAYSAAVVAAVAAVPLAGLTFARNEVYRSHLSVLLDTTAKRPGNHRAWSSQGTLYLNAGDLENADEAIRRAEELRPLFNLHVVTQRGIWLAQAGRLDEAERYYRSAISSGYIPLSTPHTWRGLAGVLIARGRPADAAKEMRSLIELQPEAAANHLLLAAAELAAGRDAEARAAAAEAVRLDPGVARATAADARQKVLAAEAAGLSPRWLGAAAVLGAAVRLDPPGAALDRRLLPWQAAAACLADGNQDPQLLDTLALTDAWVGDYPKAADAARRGVAAAEARGDTEWAAALRGRAKQYEQAAARNGPDPPGK